MSKDTKNIENELLRFLEEPDSDDKTAEHIVLNDTDGEMPTIPLYEKYKYVSY